MKLVNFYHKPISLFVMVAFTMLLCFWANPAPAAPTSEKSSTTSLAGGEDESPGVIEQEESEPVVKKGKKIPWLVIGAAVVVGAVAIYFLALKKPKYDLTVTMGQGCSGTPAATASYKKNTVVSYSYSAQSGYSNLQVKLDGAVVATAGSVTMDKAHAIDVSAAYGAVVSVTSTPSGAKIYDNYVDTGKTTPTSISYTAAGNHTYLLRQCGYQDHTQALSVQVGQNYTVNPTLVPGILDDFLVYPGCWSPFYADNWTVTNGVYRCLTSAPKFEFSYYNTVFATSSYTVEVKVKKVSGQGSYISVIMAESLDPEHLKGYQFSYMGSGSLSVFKIVDMNWRTMESGTWVWIKAPSMSPYVNRHYNAWNVMKIVRSGSNYSYYLNGHHIHSFTDTSYDARVVMLSNTIYGNLSEYQYEYVKLDFN